MSNQQPEPAPNNEPMPSARRKQPRYGSGHVLLVDGPHDGRRISGFIARGRLEYEDGEYVHVLGGDDMALYWVEYPARVEAGPTEVEQSQKWLTSMLAKASPLMASIIEQHIQDVGLVAAYCNRGLLEAQMEYIESL